MRSVQISCLSPVWIITAEAAASLRHKQPPSCLRLSFSVNVSFFNARHTNLDSVSTHPSLFQDYSSFFLNLTSILFPFFFFFLAPFLLHFQFSLHAFTDLSPSSLQSPFCSDSQSLKTNPKFPLFRAFLFPPLIIFHSSFSPPARFLSFLEIPLQVSLSVPSHSLLSFNCPLLHLVPISNFIPFIFLSSLPLPPSLPHIHSRSPTLFPSSPASLFLFSF